MRGPFPFGGNGYILVEIISETVISLLELALVLVAADFSSPFTRFYAHSSGYIFEDE